MGVSLTGPACQWLKEDVGHITDKLRQLVSATRPLNATPYGQCHPVPHGTVFASAG